MVSEVRALRIGVAGLGLIGGSLALALRDAGHEVTVFDPDAATCDLAQADGFTPTQDIAQLAAAGLDLLVLAAPLRAFEQLLDGAAQHLTPHTVVMDVGSVKQAVQHLVERCGLAHQFVGAHPMSGTERSGYRAADPALMREVQWVLTPTPASPAPGVRLVLELITRSLAGRVSVHDPATHDALVAKISHVPHLVASSLLTSVATNPSGAEALRLAAGSYRHGTRVAGTAPQRTAAMIEENRQAVVDGLDLFLADLTQLREVVAGSGDLAGRLAQAVAARELLDEVSEFGAHRSGRICEVDWEGPDWLTNLQQLSAGRRVIDCDPEECVSVS